MKKIISLFIIAFVACIYSLTAFAFDTPSDSVVITGDTYNNAPDYMTSLSSVGGSVPSGYNLVAYCSQTDYYTSWTRVTYFYASPSMASLTAFGSFSLSVEFPDSVYYVVNRFTSDGDQALISGGYGSIGSFSTRGRSGFQFVSFLPVYDQNGNLTNPPSYLNVSLNVLNPSHFLYFNTFVDTPVSGLTCDYYIFPSSLPLTGSTSSILSNVSRFGVTDVQKTSLIQRGFKWYVENVLTPFDTNNLPSDRSDNYVINAYSSSRNSLTSFNPDSYNLVYEYLGSGSVYYSADDVSSWLLDLKSVSRTGVWANSTVCLLSVCQHDGVVNYCRFDFNIDDILANNTFVPSTHFDNFTPPPSSGTVSDLQGLADYLNDLADNRIENDNIFLNNLFAGLNTIPWANFMAGGINNALPNLSFMLDSLFDSLFDKFTAPSDDDINALLADINAERSSLRAKLAFVDDVKTEYYFVISTITADNNSVPPDFEFSLPSIWSGGQNIRVKLISYEIATPEIMANIKQVITVFLSLALLLHIWRTLPATVGNMPRGDD